MKGMHTFSCVTNFVLGCLAVCSCVDVHSLAWCVNEYVHVFDVCRCSQHDSFICPAQIVPVREHMSACVCMCLHVYLRVRDYSWAWRVCAVCVCVRVCVRTCI
jgi:hypothetical protein